MADKKDVPDGPAPWGSDPIRGLNYDYLDIDRPPAVEPKSMVPEKTEFNAIQAEDFYRRVRGKIIKWAAGAGAGKEITNYILLLPDMMALFVRLMGDSRVSPSLKLEIAAASAYIISPIDLLPEAFLGPAGLIDDAIVGVIALNRVVKAMGQAGEAVLREYWDGDQDILVVISDLMNKADQFVSGPVWNGIMKFMQESGSSSSGSAAPARGPVAGNSGPLVGSSGPVIDGKARPTIKKDV